MSLNETPLGERIHIGIFGKRNAGKSSLMNAILGQDMSVVSITPGTTTDPVKKAMELLPLGPVLFIDTPGFDDEGLLGEKRVDKAYDELRHCNIVLLVTDGTTPLDESESDFLKLLSDTNIPHILCVNKCDEGISVIDNVDDSVNISCKTKDGINELKEKIAHILPSNNKRIIGDKINKGDIAVLVVPIDSAAPKGRLILPQQQTIRDILESGGIPVVARETELNETLSKLSCKPKIVITDSQAFKTVSEIVPDDIYLTSFSILMSNYKGDLSWQTEGVKAIDSLENGDSVLISEGCTHHRQCEDIGTVKIPNLLRKYTKKELDFHFTNGQEFPKDLSSYKLIIHCGGCTLNEKEMHHRIDSARIQNVPITNYGIALSYMNGILERCTEIFTS